MTEVIRDPAGNIDRIHKLEDHLSARLVERHSEIHTAVLALVAKEHWFALGEPGVAKSYMVDLIAKSIRGFPEGGKFSKLLTKYSKPEEIFGPLDPISLKNEGRYVYVTDHMAAESVFWFIDEVFKGSSAILNSFLRALMERQFDNPHPVDIPLWTMFCASNELPQGEELWALYDRILFRVQMGRIRESGNFVRMLKLAQERDVDLTPVVWWDDIVDAHEQAQDVVITDEVYETFVSLRKMLAEEGVEPSDRRFAKSLSVVKANALLEGRTEAEVSDMRQLAHVLWSRPEEQDVVERIVVGLASPLDKECIRLLDDAHQLADDVDAALSNDDDQVRLRRGSEVYGHLERLRKEFERVKEQYEEKGRRSDKFYQLQDRLQSLSERLLKEVFGFQNTE